MNDENKMKIFADKNGAEIKAGDVLYREFYVRRRERPDGRRIAINGMSGEESIVDDKGQLLPVEEKKCWIKRKVKWMGACLVADRIDCSDFQTLMSAELFDEEGKEVNDSAGFYYFNNAFNPEVYEIRNS